MHGGNLTQTEMRLRHAEALSEAAYWKGCVAMARIDDVEKNVERIKGDVLKVVDTIRSQGVELQALKDTLAANEEVDPARLDTLIASTGGIADALEASMNAPPNAPPVVVPPPITPPTDAGEASSGGNSPTNPFAESGGGQ